MSSQTLTLDKVREETPVRSFWVAAFERPEDLEGLHEDTSLLHGVNRDRWVARTSSALAEDQTDRESAAVQIIVGDEDQDRGQTPMRSSLKALSQLRSSNETVDWLEVAAILKQDVARLRLSNYSRHAAVLLAVADALTFTEPDEIPKSEEADPLFSLALGLLSEPFIAEADEEEFLAQLLAGGWNLAPSAEELPETVL